MTTISQPMDLDLFWQIVAKAHWAPDFDFRVSERNLRLALGNAQTAEAFGDRYREVRGALSRRIEQKEDASGESLGVSDDGLSDLVAHIIGLGRDEYEHSMEVYGHVVDRVRHRRYTESFSYAIPSAEHYAPDHALKTEEQRKRDRVATDIQPAVEAAVGALLAEAKRLCPELRHSPVEYHVEAGCRAALRAAFPPDTRCPGCGRNVPDGAEHECR